MLGYKPAFLNGKGVGFGAGFSNFFRGNEKLKNIEEIVFKSDVDALKLDWEQISATYNHRSTACFSG